MLLNIYKNQNMYDKQEICITFINKIFKKRVYGIESALTIWETANICTLYSMLPSPQGRRSIFHHFLCSRPTLAHRSEQEPLKVHTAG